MAGHPVQLFRVNIFNIILYLKIKRLFKHVSTFLCHDKIKVHKTFMILLATINIYGK